MKTIKNTLSNTFSSALRVMRGWLRQQRGLQVTAVTAALSSFAFSPVAMAGPEGGQVRAGDASIVNAGGGRTNILQHTQNVVIDWDTFNVAVDEHVDFQQLSSTSTALNRVTGGSLSEIFGLLTSNGIVLIVNPNGVVFSDTARVDVGGLVATTSDISNADFMSGNYAFQAVPGSEGARIVNRGQITAADGGLVALVAPGVENSGVIGARLGRVALASGEQYTLDLYGDQLISFAGSAGQIGQLYDADGQPISLVDNSGAINADGGAVYLLAADAVGLINNAISVTGVVEANTVAEQDGQIILSANGGVDVSGALSAAGDNAGENGGAVDVFGDSVTVSGSIDASGDARGGAVRVGGDFHGEGAPAANATTVTDTATIAADALTNGDGGTVVVWADGDTYYAGTISAMGGVNGGDGGFVEVSGRALLVFDGEVDTTAPNGIAGTLLLDPTNVTVADTGSQDVENGSTIAASAINRMLRNGMSVIIDADDTISVEARIDGRSGIAGAGLELDANSILIMQPIVTNNGAIMVSAGEGGITMSGEAFLAVANDDGLGNRAISLDADGTIVAKNLLTLGNVTLTSRDGAVRIDDGLFGLGAGIGSLTVEADDEVVTNGLSVSGNVTIDAGGDISNSSASVIAGGDISLSSSDGGTMMLGAGNTNAAVLDAGGAVTFMTTGAVNVSGDIAAGSQINVTGTGDSAAGSFEARTLEAGVPGNGSVSIQTTGEVNVKKDIVANSVTVFADSDISVDGAIVGFDQNGDEIGDGANDVSILSAGGNISVGAVTVAGQDDLELTTDGANSSIEVGGALVSSQGISLTTGSGGVDMTGSGTVLDAADDITIATTGAIDLGTDGDARSESGAIQFGTTVRAGAVTAGVLQAGGNVGIYSSSTVSAGDITTVNSGNVEVIAAGLIDIGTIAGVDDDDADDFDGVNSVVLTSETAGVALEGAQTSAGSIEITAAGEITNTGASLISAANLSLQSASVGGDGVRSINDGTIRVDDLPAEGLEAVLVAAGDVDIDTTGTVDINGDIVAGVSILMGSIDEGGSRVGAVDIGIDPNDNDGVLQAGGNVGIYSSSTVSAGDITTVNSGNVEVIAAGLIDIGTIAGVDDDDADDFDGVNSVVLTSETAGVALEGAQTSAGSIEITAAGEITNTGASLISAANLSLQSASVGGDGVRSINDGTIRVDDLPAEGLEAVLVAAGDVDIDTTGTVDINGDIVAGVSILMGSIDEGGSRVGAVDIGIDPNDNDGVLQAGGNVGIYSSSTVSAGDITTVNSGNVEVIAAGLIDIGTIAGVDDDDADDFDGVNSVVLTSETAGVALEGAQTSAGSIEITAAGEITNTGASLISAANLSLQSASVGGDGVRSINDGTIRVDDLPAEGLEAVLVAAGDVDIDTTGTVDINGDIVAGVSILMGSIDEGGSRVGAVDIGIDPNDNDGVLQAGGNVGIYSSSTVSAGDITTVNSGNVEVIAAGLIDIGTIAGVDDDDADDFDGVNSVVLTSETAGVALEGAQTSAGSIEITAAGEITNTGASLISAANLSLQSASVGGDGVRSINDGTIRVDDLPAEGLEAVLVAAGDVDIDTTGTVDINGDIVAGVSILMGSIDEGGSRVGAVDIGIDPNDNDGVLQAGGNVGIYSSSTVSAGDITTVNSGNVEVIAAGPIDIGTIAGVDDDDADDFDGVNSVVLTSETAGVALEGAQTSAGSIEITAAGEITNTGASLISAAGLVLEAGGNVMVNGGEAVIDAAGEVDIDAGGNVTLGGDARSRSASLSIDAANIVVGVIDGDSIDPRHDLVAATDLVINASGDVTTGGLAAGQNVGDQLQIIASGDIDIGAVTGSADPDGDGIFDPVVAGDTNGNGIFDPDVDSGAGTGVYHVTIRTTDGNIITNGIDAGGDPNSNELDNLVGPGDVFLLDANGNLKFGGVWLDAGLGEIQVNEAILSGGIVVIGPGRANVNCSVDGDCPSLALNHNIFSEGSNVYVNANTTMFDGFRRVAILDEDPNNGFGTIVVDRNGNPIDSDLYQEFDVDLVPPDEFKGCSSSGSILACDEPSGSPFNLCTREGNDCPNRIDTFGELFRYVESNYRLVDGSDISNVIDRLDVFSSNFNEEASPEEINQANNRERRFAELLGSAAITIDTTVGIEAGFRASVRFAGNVHREEGDLSIALPDEVTGDFDTLGILPSYVNHTLIINTGPSTGQARFIGDVGSSTDEAFQLTLGRGSCPDFDQCVTDMYLGAFDLEVTGQVVIGANRLNSIRSANINVANQPVLFFDYVGTEDNRPAPRENVPGSFSGSNTFSLGDSMAGSGANSGPTQSGSGATGGSSQAGTIDGSGQTQSGNGATGGPSQAGNGDSVNPGDNSASSGSNDPNPGLGEDLGDPPPPDEATPSNLDETQKQDEETKEDDEESDDEDSCPKGATQYADYGNVPGELGTQGNVFEKCSSELVAATED